MKRAVDRSAFGARVAQRREELKLSQTQLGDAVGMKQQGIVSIEKGDVARPRLLSELCQALRTTEKWLLWGEGGTVVENPEAPISTVVPLLDWVSAGKLVDTASQVPTYDVPLLAFADLGRGDFFGLRVAGDSMDRLSPDGSIIVVNREERRLVNGKPYVFSHKGETTYKLWRPEPPRMAPHSTGLHEPIFLKSVRDIEVVGRVRRTMLEL